MTNFFLIIYRIDQIKWLDTLIEPSDVPTTCFRDVIASFRPSERSYEGQRLPDGLEWQTFFNHIQNQSDKMVGYTFRTVRCTYHVFPGRNCVIPAIGKVIWGPETSRRARTANFFLIIYKIDQLKWLDTLSKPSDVPATCFRDVIASFRPSERSFEYQSLLEGKLFLYHIQNQPNKMSGHTFRTVWCT